MNIEEQSEITQSTQDLLIIFNNILKTCLSFWITIHLNFESSYDILLMRFDRIERLITNRDDWNGTILPLVVAGISKIDQRWKKARTPESTYFNKLDEKCSVSQADLCDCEKGRIYWKINKFQNEITGPSSFFKGFKIFKN